MGGAMRSDEQFIEGLALLGSDLEPLAAGISVRDGKIHHIEEMSRVPERWICPHFYNAHTHIGDTIAMDPAVTGDLASLVAPPDGLKHRILRNTPPDQLEQGMRESILQMIGSGTRGCADFREGGVQGVVSLREAARDLPFSIFVLGRDGGESIADGIGISSTRDFPEARNKTLAVKSAQKKVAVHAGERDREDIEAAFALEPDLIVHFTHANPGDIRRCQEEEIPIAVCVRSNWALHATSAPDMPPIRDCLAAGCRVVLGTDNVMFVQPDLFAEMQFMSFGYRIEPREILRAAVLGSEVFGSPHWIDKDNRASFFWIDIKNTNFRYSRDPVSSLVKRGAGGLISGNVFSSR